MRGKPDDITTISLENNINIMYTGLRMSGPDPGQYRGKHHQRRQRHPGGGRGRDLWDRQW